MGNVVITTDPAGNIMSGMSLNSTYSRTPLEKFQFELQSKIDRDWDNCSDRYIIGEETVFGSNVFNDVEVRLQHEVVSDTGVKLGDDFKEIIFKDISHARGMGFLYYFNSNYWLTASTVCRRCNNMLRWVDEDGNYYSEYCSIDYPISRANVREGTEDPVVGQGNLPIIRCQLNSRTRKIKPNQRFLFGNVDNWTTIRILPVGVKNYMNNSTINNDSCSLLELVGQINFDNNANDDLINGIADFYKYSSGSNLNSIVVSPSGSGLDIIEGLTQVYSVYSYSGGSPVSGSFVFGVDVSSTVPTNHYVFTSLSGNTFSVKNLEAYFDSSLIINCVGASGSRIVELNLNGAW